MSLFRLVCCLLLGQVLASQSVSAGSLTISTNNTPIDRQVLQLVSEQAFRRIGREFQLINLPSERSLIEANEGAIDGEGLRVSGLESSYPNLVRVPEAYTQISFVAFSRDATIKLAGWKSLQPYRVAFINGWKLFESKAGNARRVNKVSEPQQLFHMLDQGRIDLALYTLADGNALIREMNLLAIAPLFPTLKDVDMYLYLHRRHQDLVEPLARAMSDSSSRCCWPRSGILPGISNVTKK